MKFNELTVEHDGEVYVVREMGALPRLRLFKDVGENEDAALMALCAGLAASVYQNGEKLFADAEAAGDVPQSLFEKLSVAWRKVNGVGDIDPNG